MYRNVHLFLFYISTKKEGHQDPLIHLCRRIISAYKMPRNITQPMDVSPDICKAFMAITYYKCDHDSRRCHEFPLLLPCTDSQCLYMRYGQSVHHADVMPSQFGF